MLSHFSILTFVSVLFGCRVAGRSFSVLIRGEGANPSRSPLLSCLWLADVYEVKRLCFRCSLLEKIEQETWRETGISFVTSVTRLVERLLDYRCLGVSP